MSYCKLIYHLVFPTYRRGNDIPEAYERELYAYMLGVMRNLGAYVFRIGGMPDHVHIIVEIPAKISVSDFVRIVKCSTSAWLKRQEHFPEWKGWAEGYAAFTCLYNNVKTHVAYVMGQKTHHRKASFQEECERLWTEHGIVKAECPWFG